MIRPGALVSLAALALLAGCGGGDTTTVINQTTTTVAGDTSSSTTTESTTETTSTEDDDSAEDGGVEAGDDDSGPVLSLKSFSSPTGNIGCLMSAKSVRCDIGKKQWSAPRPPDCPEEVDSGQGLTLPATGPASVVCAGDTVLNPQAPTLDYGSSSRIGSITCHSDESEVECENESGGSFSLSIEEYDLN